MVQLLGPLPVDIFQRGKFFPDFHTFSAKVSQQDGMFWISCGDCHIVSSDSYMLSTFSTGYPSSMLYIQTIPILFKHMINTNSKFVALSKYVFHEDKREILKCHECRKLGPQNNI